MEEHPWFTAHMYGFCLTPRQTGNVLRFREYGVLPIVIWILILCPGIAILVDATREVMARNTYYFTDPGMLVFLCGALLYVPPAAYRLFRIISRTKRLEIDMDLLQAEIVESWPHPTKQRADLVHVEFMVSPLTFRGGKASLEGYAAWVRIRDASFVLAVRQQMEPAYRAFPQMLRDIGVDPVYEARRIRTTMPM